MHEFLIRLQDILSSFLGEPKRDITEGGQMQFPCPHCIEEKGEKERTKYNLEVNCIKGVYRCWSCSEYDDEMHGSIKKLFKLFAPSKTWEEYVNLVKDFKKSEIYKLKFKNNEFDIESDFAISESIELPSIYERFVENGYNPRKPLEYLQSRGIGWDIINQFKIGYTKFDRNNIELSTRIIIPSYNQYGELNYWTGRDYTDLPFKQKYFNPQVEKKEIIFNEEQIQWDADITLVEGPMDAIVVPNAIPMLGKCLKTDYAIFEKIMKLASANINVWLDGDALKDCKKVYKLLNQGRLKGKIKYIPTDVKLDPSKIYELYGKKGIIEHLKNAKNFDEFELI